MALKTDPPAHLGNDSDYLVPRSIRIPQWVDEELELLASRAGKTVVRYIADLAVAHVEQESQTLAEFRAQELDRARQKFQAAERRAEAHARANELRAAQPARTLPTEDRISSTP